MSHRVSILGVTRTQQGQILVKHLPTLQAVCKRLGYGEPRRLSDSRYHVQIGKQAYCEFDLATGDERFDTDFGDQAALEAFRTEYKSDANQTLKRVVLARAIQQAETVQILQETADEIRLRITR